ncbi:hypothetical protein WJX75_006934 [Coccomyxa subellipsoidea]|uniref:SHSP domain-containing protein n=1 Tax=Coccomyxa subellipsoidea TaxID=248742 RepID=A0ABR2Z565_9CHLO
MYCSTPFFVLEQLLDQPEEQPAVPQNCRASASSRSRSFCHGRYPYAQQASPRARTPSPARGSMEVRELNDSYVLFIDVPGFSRNDVSVTVEGDNLFISATHKSSTGIDHSAGPSKDVVVERPRGGVKRTWRLPKDALLDGIHAKVNNGELVISVPKRKAFRVPVLGADSKPAALPAPVKEATKEAAPALEAPSAVSEPAPVLAAPSEPAHVAEASPAESPAAEDAPAAVEKVSEQDAAMADAEESDGSWEDLSDEEREAEAARRRAKGKLPLEGPVLEEIERQEAEMRAQQQDSDSD